MNIEEVERLIKFAKDNEIKEFKFQDLYFSFVAGKSAVLNVQDIFAEDKIDPSDYFISPK